MIETAILLGVAIGILLLAQIGEYKAWARWASMLIALGIGLVIAAGGVAVWLSLATFKQIDAKAASGGVGWLLIATGLAIILPVGIAIIATFQKKNLTIRGVPWTRPVHLTAWMLLAVFIGSNFTLTAAKSLSEIEIQKPLELLLVQNTAFALAALVGVGLGLRRNWREVVERLGLRRLAASDVTTSVVMALAMLMITGIVGGLIALILGGDLTAASSFNEQLLARLPGVAGVLLMGLATGVGEEMIYRGALQPALGVWITSFLFAISHIQYLNPGIIVIFALGLLLGYTRNKWGLTTAILTHAVYNSLVGLLALMAMNSDLFTLGK